jgi:hypothetical protein
MSVEKKQAKKKLPQILLISGSGRNCGKTSLACALISQLSSSKKVVGLKISPHFHKIGHKQELLFENKDVKIYQEKDSTSGKDSARMLRAGAIKSYFIQCEDKNISEAWDWIVSKIPENVPVVCESGSLASVFKPGLHLLVKGKNPDKLKRSYVKNKELSDKIVHFDGQNFDLNFTGFSYSGNQWTLKELQNDQIRRSA